MRAELDQEKAVGDRDEGRHQKRDRQMPPEHRGHRARHGGEREEENGNAEEPPYRADESAPPRQIDRTALAAEKVVRLDRLVRQQLLEHWPDGKDEQQPDEDRDRIDDEVVRDAGLEKALAHRVTAEQWKHDRLVVPDVEPAAEELRKHRRQRNLEEAPFARALRI